MLGWARSHTRGIIATFGFVLVAHLSLVLGYLPLDGDVVRQFYPWHQWAGEVGLSLAGTWLPLVGCGMPGGANGQIGHFFVLNFPFALPLPTYAALSIATLLCFLAGAAGAYVLCRDYGAGTLAAVLGAGLFGSMGAMLGHIQHLGLIGAACWIPWQWVAAKRLANGRSKAYLGLIAFLAGMQLLASHPQVTGIGILSAGIVYLLEHTTRRTAGWTRSALGAFGVVLAGGIGGAVLAAVQVFPMYELARHSVRAGKLSYEFVTSLSLPWTHLARFAVPNLFGGPSTYASYGNYHELHGYLGILPLILAIWAIVRVRSRGVKIMVILGSLSLVLALGGNTPLYRVLYHLPFFGNFRVPARWLLCVCLAMSVIAALGADELVRRIVQQGQGSWSRWLTVSGAVLLAGWLGARLLQPVAIDWMMRLVESGALPSPSTPLGAPLADRVAYAYTCRILAPTATLLGAAFALLIASAAMRFATQSKRRVILVGLVCGAVVESAIFCNGYLPGIAPSQWQKRPLMARYMKPFPEDGRYWYDLDNGWVRDRIGPQVRPPQIWLQLPRPNYNVAWDRASAQVYDPIRPQAVANLIATLEEEVQETQVAAAAGIEYVVVSPAHAGKYEGWKKVGEGFNGLRILRNPDYAGPVYIIGAEDVGADAGQYLRTPENDGATFSIMRWDAHGIEFDAHMPRAGSIVVTNTFYPGWSAKVDGADADLFRTNISMTGLKIPAGRHHVVMEYRNRAMLLGGWISLVALLIFAGAMGFLYRRGADACGSGDKRRSN